MTICRASPRPLFCIIDPNLKDFVGHHYEYDQATADGALAAGYAPVVLSHRHVIAEIRSRLSVRPAFRSDIWAVPDGNSPAAADLAANEQFRADLAASVATLPLERDSILFGHMVTWRQLLGWAQFAHQSLEGDGPGFRLLLRYEPHLYGGALADRAFELLRRAASGGRLRLGSDSGRIARELEAMTGLAFETWPIPHTGGGTGAGDPAPGGGPALKVVSLGNARVEKGLVELIDAIRVINGVGRGSQFEFVLQVNDAEPALSTVLQSFASERHPNVTLVTEALSSQDYHHLLSSAGLVALPYHRGTYEARTSGVFVEALAAGKPVICTSDTWMCDQLDGVGAGLTVIDRDPEDLVRALLRARETYPRLAERAAVTRAAWVERHNPLSLVRALSDPAPAIPPAAAPDPSVLVLAALGGGALERERRRRLDLLLRFLSRHTNRLRVLEDRAGEPRVRQGVVYAALPSSLALRSRSVFRLLCFLLRRGLGAHAGEAEAFACLVLLPFSKTIRRQLEHLVRGADLVLMESAAWAPMVRRACRDVEKPSAVTQASDVSNRILKSRPLAWLSRRLERRLARPPRHDALPQAHVPPGPPREGTMDVPCIDANMLNASPLAGRLELVRLLCGLPEEGRHLILLRAGERDSAGTSETALRRVAAAFVRENGAQCAHFVLVDSAAARPPQAGLTAAGELDGPARRMLLEACTVIIVAANGVGEPDVEMLEALAAGKVVMGPARAFQGFGRPSEACWIAENNLRRYPEILARLLRDDVQRAEMARAAAAFGWAHDSGNVFAPLLRHFPRQNRHRARETRASSDRAKSVLAAARIGLGLGRAKLAEDLVEGLIATEPGLGDAYCIRAQFRLRRGDGLSALADLDVALERGASARQVLQVRAQILSSLGREADSNRALEAARAFHFQNF